MKIQVLLGCRQVTVPALAPPEGGRLHSVEVPSSSQNRGLLLQPMTSQKTSRSRTAPRMFARGARKHILRRFDSRRNLRRQVTVPALSPLKGGQAALGRGTENRTRATRPPALRTTTIRYPDPMQQIGAP